MFITIDETSYNILDFTAYQILEASGDTPLGVELRYKGNTKITVYFDNEDELAQFITELGTTYIQISDTYYNGLYFTAYFKQDVQLPTPQYNLIVHYNGSTKLTFSFDNEADRENLINTINNIGGGGGGGGTSEVTSVNGMKGAVVLTATNIRASSGETVESEIQKITAINNQVTTINGQVSTLSTEVETLESDLSSTNTNVSSIETEVSTINTNIGDLNTDIQTTNSNVSAIDTRLTNTTTKVNQIDTSLTTTIDRVVALETKDNDLEGRVSNLETIFNEVVTDEY